jgi:hypothetical protein
MPALLLLAALTAAGQVRHVRLDYRLGEGTSACPAAATVRADVAGRLGTDPFDEVSPATLEVVVSRSGEGFRAELTLREGDQLKGARKLSGVRADCSDLASALPFALTVAIEAFSEAEPAPAPPPAAKTEAPPDSTPAPAPPVAPSVRTAGADWHVLASASPGIAFGEAPGPAFTAALGVGVEGGLFTAALEGRFLAPASMSVGTGQIQTSSFAAELVACLRYRWISGCVLGGGGALWSSAYGLPDAHGITTPVGSLGGRAQVALPLSAFAAIAVRGELRGALVRTAIEVGSTEVWRTPPVSGALSLAVMLSWPVTVSRDGDK